MVLINCWLITNWFILLCTQRRTAFQQRGPIKRIVFVQLCKNMCAGIHNQRMRMRPWTVILQQSEEYTCVREQIEWATWFLYCPWQCSRQWQEIRLFYNQRLASTVISWSTTSGYEITKHCFVECATYRSHLLTTWSIGSHVSMPMWTHRETVVSITLVFF